MLSEKEPVTEVPREFVNVVMLMDTHNRVHLNDLTLVLISSIDAAYNLFLNGIPN